MEQRVSPSTDQNYGNKTARGTADKSKTKREGIFPCKEMVTIHMLEEHGYSDVPIQVAAARLGLGVSTLKRVCRDNNISRWPYRQRKSLGTLTDCTKHVLDDGTGQDNMSKLAALQVLEDQRQIMRNFQNQDMDDKIKSYRQALFKLDHQGRNSPKASANPLKTKLTAVSAGQRVLPCQSSVVPTEH